MRKLISILASFMFLSFAVQARDFCGTWAVQRGNWYHQVQFDNYEGRDGYYIGAESSNLSYFDFDRLGQRRVNLVQRDNRTGYYNKCTCTFVRGKCVGRFSDNRGNDGRCILTRLDRCDY